MNPTMTASAMKATPFSKILIANRGEIAVRIMRTAKAMGLRTVAVYSSADLHARHVSCADQAVCIGEPLPTQSYLHIPAILEAARLSGADAVHPGYGFLAENEQFATACAEAGLVFIGPSPQSIRLMGDKAGAKRIMMDAGVPCVPGYQGDDQSEQRLRTEADHLGYPLMIKATAGGGGRGMRLVESSEQFLQALRGAQSEALSAFGSSVVILEKAIQAPRHIEIQVFGDRHGHTVHMGERDCSVQRRHQKIIEESPSPAVDAALRERMGATAVTAARTIGYEGAGTLEFLLDSEGQYYFMEMNTRLQVEHPVTEAVTGLDLVEWQLRVAAGEPLPLAQQEISFRGHAIEVRLCAEDPVEGFMPQSGLMHRWNTPPELRVEHAMAPGTLIPPFYDSMIAKLIASGGSRDEARRKLLRGVEDTVALGIATNKAFLARCLAHPVFAAGNATTSFIGQHEADLLAPRASDALRAAVVAAWLLHRSEGAPWQGRRDHGLHHSLALGMRFNLNGAERSASISHTPAGDFNIVIDEHSHALEPVAQDEHAVRFILDGLMESAVFERQGSSLWLHHAGESYSVQDLSRQPVLPPSATKSDGFVRAAMNGRVMEVLVSLGDSVTPGQALVTLEAMKMQHVHTASVAGTVQALHVRPGEQVQGKDVMVEISNVEAAR